MVVLKKRYFLLEEIAEAWRLPMRDLAYMAENGQLRVSVRLFNVRLEWGAYELDAIGGAHAIPIEEKRFTGLQDLTRQDAFEVFAEGSARILHFEAPEDRYVTVLRPEEGVLARREQLVIRRSERERWERENDLSTSGSREAPELQQFDDYRQVRLGDLRLSLGCLQARVVQRLHEAANSGEPWCGGKAVLSEAGSSSKRMADVFKSQPQWRELIESDRRGNYRLRIKLR